MKKGSKIVIALVIVSLLIFGSIVAYLSYFQEDEDEVDDDDEILDAVLLFVINNYSKYDVTATFFFNSTTSDFNKTYSKLVPPMERFSEETNIEKGIYILRHDIDCERQGSTGVQRFSIENDSHIIEIHIRDSSMNMHIS